MSRARFDDGNGGGQLPGLPIVKQRASEEATAVTTGEQADTTLYDIAGEFGWVRELGWSDDELRRVPIHGQAPKGGWSMDLSAVGGAPVGVAGSAASGGDDARGSRAIWVYRKEVPPELWAKLQEVYRRATADSVDAARAALGDAASGTPGTA